MFASLAEDFDQQFGGAVDDLRMTVEIRIRVHESVEGDDLFHFIEGAEGFLDDCEAVEDNDSRALDRIFDGTGGRDFTEDFRFSIDGQSTGKEEQVAAADAVHVSGDWLRDFGEFEAEGFDFGEDVVLHAGRLFGSGARVTKNSSDLE